MSTVAHYAVMLARGPNWDNGCGIREQQGWEAHAAFMDSLVTGRFILLGGPIGDQRQTLHLVEAADEEHIRRRLADDPWAHAGLLEIASIQPWALWLDFRSAAEG